MNARPEVCLKKFKNRNLLFRRIWFRVPKLKLYDVTLRYKKKNPGKDWVPTLQRLEQSTVIISTGTTHREVKEWMEQNQDTSLKVATNKVNKEVASEGKVEQDGSNEISSEEATEGDEGKEEVEVIYRDEPGQHLNEEEQNDGEPMENKDSTKYWYLRLLFNSRVQIECHLLDGIDY